MNKIELTKGEKEILKAEKLGEFKSIANLAAAKRKYAKIASNTLRKNKSITIRQAERDIQKVKVKALEEGLPYQTFITSIIHKHIY